MNLVFDLDMLHVILPLYRMMHLLALEDLDQLLVVLPPLSIVDTYLSFIPMGFDHYLMVLKSGKGMWELSLPLEDVCLYFSCY